MEDIDPSEEVKLIENNVRKYLKEKNISAMDVLVIMMASFKAVMHAMNPNDFMEFFKKAQWEEDKISSVIDALMFIAQMTHKCTSIEEKENAN